MQAPHPHGSGSQATTTPRPLPAPALVGGARLGDLSDGDAAIVSRLLATLPQLSNV